MPPGIVLNARRVVDAAQEQIVPVRLASYALQEAQGQINPHSIVTRAASSSSADQSAPLVVALIALASLIVILVLGGSIFLIRYRRVLSGASTRSTKCANPHPPEKRTRFCLPDRWGAKRAQSVEPQYIVHRGEGGIIHCQTPPPADLKSILLEPISNDKGCTDFESQLPQTPPRYRIPSLAFDPRECSISTIPRAPDNSLAQISLDHSLFSRSSLERASSADAYPLTEASINGFMLTRTSTESSTYPSTPMDDGLVTQFAVDRSKQSQTDERGGLFKQLSTMKTRAIPSSPTPPRSSQRISSSSPSLLQMIKAGSMNRLLSPTSSSSGTSADMEELVLDISRRKKTATDMLFGTWRPPSIIISPPTNSNLALRSSLASDCSLPSTVYASRQLEKERDNQHMWQTSTPPRNSSRSTRKKSVQRSIST